MTDVIIESLQALIDVDALQLIAERDLKDGRTELSFIIKGTLCYALFETMSESKKVSEYKIVNSPNFGVVLQIYMNN